MEREEEPEVEHEEEKEVEQEQGVEKKHGQEEKQEGMLQALGQRFSRSPCWKQRGTSLCPKGCCSLLRAHTGTGEKREEEGAAEQSCGGSTATAPDPCTSRAAGWSSTRA